MLSISKEQILRTTLHDTTHYLLSRPYSATPVLSGDGAALGLKANPRSINSTGKKTLWTCFSRSCAKSSPVDISQLYRRARPRLFPPPRWKTLEGSIKARQAQCMGLRQRRDPLGSSAICHPSNAPADFRRSRPSCSIRSIE